MSFWRRVTGICIAAGLLAGAAILPARAQDAAGRAAAAYHAGKVLDAVAQLEKAIPSASDAQQWGLVSLLFDICAGSYDSACLARNTPLLVKAADAVKEPAVTAPRIAYAVAVQAYLAGDMDFFRKTTSLDFAAKVADPLRDPVLATRFFLLNAKVWQHEGRYDLARKYLDRAFVSLLRIDHGKYGFYLAQLLKDLIRANFDNHDVARALKWLAASAPLLDSQLPASGMDHADYVWLLAGAASEAADFPRSAEGYDRALAAIKPIQIQPVLKEAFASDLVIARAATLAIQGDLHGAHAFLATDPVRSRRNAIIAAGSFQTYAELYYAASEIFFDVLDSAAPDPRWEPLFAQPVTMRFGSEASDLVTAYRGVALALLRLKSDPAAARRMMNQAIAGRLDAFRRQRQDSTAFPLPSLLDRMLFGISAGSWTAEGGEGDLLVGGMELLNRNPRYAVSDVLARLAAQTDEEQRRAAHSLLRLNDRHDAWQLAQLESLVARVAGGKPFPATSFAPQIAGMRFGAATERLAGAVGAAQAGLPSLKELQAGLSSQEAFMGFVAGRALCVRPGGLWVHGLTGQDRAMLDMRLLASALSAGGAPSDSRDSQYPAEAAVRLYHFLFDGFETCLAGVHHILFFPSGNLAAVPLAALLKEVPPKLGEGYDLSKGAWLMRDFAFSQVPSTASFLSARQLAAGSSGDLLFAGVGDPRLKRALPAAGGETRLSDLEELPDTATELKALAGLAGHGPQLLLGEDATEEKFRALPLSRFRLLHFATHGLVRGDIDGLGEAALVLTPGDAMDKVNDGLLTATDAANLNLAARLIVLSACNTANFDVSAFNAQVQGLATAFAVAGVPATVASLWAVDSKSSAALMTAFYKHLMTSASAAEALREASLETFTAAPGRAYYHPRFWAPFIVMGDGGVTVRPPSAAAAYVPSVQVAADGGEVIGAATMNGLLVTSEIGPSTNGRHAALLVARDGLGKASWSVEDKETGAGRVIVAGGNLVVAGYRWNGAAVPELRAFSPAGKLLWRKLVPSPNAGATIGGLVATADGFVAVLEPFQQDKDAYRFDIVRFDNMGAEKARRTIGRSMPGLWAGALEPTLLVENGTLYLAVHHGFTAMTLQRTDFGLPTACGSGSGAHLYRLDAASLAEKGFAALPDLRIAKLVRTKDALFYAGSRHAGCDFTAEKAELGVIGDDLSARPAWVDDAPFYGRLAGLHATPQGLFAAAEIAEPIDVGPSAEGAPDGNALLAKHPAGDSDTLREGVSLMFDTGGQLRTRRYLGSGLSQGINGSLRAGTADIVYGSAGFNPWIERLN